MSNTGLCVFVFQTLRHCVKMYLLNSERDDEVCDARDDDSSTAAG